MPSTRLIVRGAPLPPSFKGNLNKFYQALLDRLEVIAPFGQVQLQIGGLKPTSNIGLWVKDSQKIYVWDEASKDYIPLDISDSLGPVTDAINSALAPYAKTSDVTAAIAAAAATINAQISSLTSQVGSSASIFSANQTDGLATASLNNSSDTISIPFNQIDYDTLNKFANGKYTIPATGKYRITFRIHTEVISGTASAVSIISNLINNGAGIGAAVCPNNGLGTYVDMVIVEKSFAAGDQISANVVFNASGGPITLRVVPNNVSLTISQV